MQSIDCSSHHDIDTEMIVQHPISCSFVRRFVPNLHTVNQPNPDAYQILSPVVNGEQIRNKYEGEVLVPLRYIISQEIVPNCWRKVPP